MFKRLSENIVLFVITTVLMFTLLELLLRFGDFKNMLENVYPYPKGYFAKDPSAEYDIACNFPATDLSLKGVKFKVWSNELGCFDFPYRGEKEYILLVGDSFCWGYSEYEKP